MGRGDGGNLIVHHFIHLRPTPITHNPADMYQGLAQMFQRVADDVKRFQVGQGGEEVETLLDWAKRGEEEPAKRE